MLNTSVTNVGPPLTIIGKDLDVIATFNADLNPNAGKQQAGRFMSFDAATDQLTPWDGLGDAAGATIFGVLADGFDITGQTTEVTAAVMVYRGGTFLRQEIESANNAAIPPGGPLDNALRILGIQLEYSYDAYTGLEPVPAGGKVYPMPAAELAEKEEKPTEPGPGPAPEPGPGAPEHQPGRPGLPGKPGKSGQPVEERRQ
jgi:hypothetical protein